MSVTILTLSLQPCNPATLTLTLTLTLTPNPNVAGNWYMCMQKQFKRHAEMDALVCAVLAADPSARIILHDTESAHGALPSLAANRP